MEWTVQDLGALGEFIGAIAVVATLAYLAVQVRRTRAEMRRALSQGRLDSNRELVALELDELNLAAVLKANVALDWEAGPMLEQLMEKCGLNPWRKLTECGERRPPGGTIVSTALLIPMNLMLGKGKDSIARHDIDIRRVSLAGSMSQS